MGAYYTYSKPLFVTYGHGLLVMTNALTTNLIPPPGSKNGRVEDIHLRSTVTFTNTTTAALVNVGTAASATKYAQLNCGVTAAGASLNGPVISSDINFDRDGVTSVQLQVVAPTGGSPAGTGFLDVIMAWY